MARGRRRHGARPPRRRGRWYAGAAAALATAAAVLIGYGAWTPSTGTDTASTASSRPSTALPPGSPHPTSSPAPSRSPSPSTSASASPRTAPEASPRTTPKPNRTASRTSPRPTAAPAGKRLITVVNKTPKTVWAVVTNTAVYPAGRKLAPGQSLSVTVADDWGGRIWGRTGCTDGTAAGPCASGDC
ncbi:thaumatin family protein, partial [Streptomyces sp. NPDC005921]